MLRHIRIVLASIFFIAITLLFLDITGVMHLWFGWMAKVQFLPAVFAANFAVVAGLVLLTLIFGRVYCSVICPMGVFQDIVSRLRVTRDRRRKNHKHFAFSGEKRIVRYGVLILFISALLIGFHAFVAILAPYSSYGRIAQNLFAPIVQGINNLFAIIAERAGSYAFYTRDVWIHSLPTLIIAAITFVVVVILAWKGGRTYCNTICPVGTVLGLLSRFSLFRPVIDREACKNCRVCEHNCKASCIDISTHSIDASRCVSCFDCIDNCKFSALKYRFAYGRKDAASEALGQSPGMTGESSDTSRRAFLIGAAALATTAVAKAQQKKVDGGYAAVMDKKVPHRDIPVTPFGSRSVKDFYNRCTACQLCVATCPNGVLRPSTDFDRLMQPEMSYERGYCRPECTKCSEVCPAGAILPITPEEKTSYKVGLARVDRDLCVVETKGVSCGNCARRCPVGAIRMVLKDPSDPKSLRIPTVIETRCIGCGACENLCPSRPISAITVNGRENHIEKLF